MSKINIRGFNQFTRNDVVFESVIPDADGCKFFVASTDNFKTSMYDVDTSTGLLVAFGPDELKDEESGVYSDYFAFSPDDDRKFIAKQLRELADWFDKQ